MIYFVVKKKLKFKIVNNRYLKKIKQKEKTKQ